MIVSEPNSICGRAEIYYYDYLCSEHDEPVPKEILGHISQCSRCKTEIARLKDHLAEAKEHATEGTREKISAVTTTLSLHFAYAGAVVNCDTVRPFLPTMAHPTLSIRVPTPITVHVDKCQRCTDDLEAIVQLKLKNSQLSRLGRLFAEEHSVEADSCAESQNGIVSLSALAFEGISATTLQHLCVCQACRSKLFEERMRRYERLSDHAEGSETPCDRVATADIFDYVVPYGIDPENYQYARFRQSLTSHLTSCQRCLQKMQDLHGTVYGILDRSESGIVTCFRVAGSKQDSVEIDADNPYAGWPIEVQVFDESKEIETIASPESALIMQPEQKHRLNIRPFIKPLAIAAVLFFAALLILNVPVAKAVDLGRIYKSLEQMKNVYIATFDHAKAEPTQEMWISQTLNTVISRSETECVLWDLKHESKKTKDLITGSVRMVKLTESEIARAVETMPAPWGLLPFDDISKIPPGATWEQATDQNNKTAIAGAKAYDLIWTEQRLGGATLHCRWRGYVNTRTELPKRVERWQKQTGQEEYELITVMEVSYPTAGEISTIIEDSGLH